MSAETETETAEGYANRPQVLVALLIGGVLTLIGILGPLLAGANEPLFGIFGRNYLHDAIHIVTGLAGLGAGIYAGSGSSGSYNRYFGLLYLLVFVAGVAVLLFSLEALNVININWADNWLHLGLGAVLAGVGYGYARRGDERRSDERRRT
ncbi:hypothetical protein BRC81_10850 [Halobacteriales archaeon QS_1_68_20]|nr:MAG: hypothetical protein BRC81_10850 [Halobacteriales archaeon QS_1_68_20]